MRSNRLSYLGILGFCVCKCNGFFNSFQPQGAKKIKKIGPSWGNRWERDHLSHIPHESPGGVIYSSRLSAFMLELCRFCIACFSKGQDWEKYKRKDYQSYCKTHAFAKALCQ